MAAFVPWAAHRRPTDKPHIFKCKTDWVCVGSKGFGWAKKPVTAFNAYFRKVRFHQRYPRGINRNLGLGQHG
jgi:hypothetical protein